MCVATIIYHILAAAFRKLSLLLVGIFKELDYVLSKQSHTTLLSLLL
jgi:hypothetical protein